MGCWRRFGRPYRLPLPRQAAGPPSPHCDAASAWGGPRFAHQRSWGRLPRRPPSPPARGAAPEGATPTSPTTEPPPAGELGPAAAPEAPRAEGTSSRLSAPNGLCLRFVQGRPRLTEAKRGDLPILRLLRELHARTPIGQASPRSDRLRGCPTPAGPGLSWPRPRLCSRRSRGRLGPPCLPAGAERPRWPPARFRGCPAQQPRGADPPGRRRLTGLRPQSA